MSVAFVPLIRARVEMLKSDLEALVIGARATAECQSGALHHLWKGKVIAYEHVIDHLGRLLDDKRSAWEPRRDPGFSHSDTYPWLVASRIGAGPADPNVFACRMSEQDARWLADALNARDEAQP